MLRVCMHAQLNMLVCERQPGQWPNNNKKNSKKNNNKKNGNDDDEGDNDNNDMMIMKMVMKIIIMMIIIAFKGAIRDFFFFFFCNLLTALRTVFNMYSQMVRTQSCANLVQHIQRLLRAECRVTCYVVRRNSSSIKFDRVEIAFILALLYWLNHEDVSNLVCQCLLIPGNLQSLKYTSCTSPILYSIKKKLLSFNTRSGERIKN